MDLHKLLIFIDFLLLLRLHLAWTQTSIMLNFDFHIILRTIQLLLCLGHIFRGGASLYLPVSVRLPACPKFVGSKLYSPNFCLGKYYIGLGVNVMLFFVCSCHGQYPLVWTLTSGNTISAGRTDGSTPPTSVT